MRKVLIVSAVAALTIVVALVGVVVVLCRLGVFLWTANDMRAIGWNGSACIRSLVRIVCNSAALG
jgi:hypothetical protein